MSVPSVRNWSPTALVLASGLAAGLVLQAGCGGSSAARPTPAETLAASDFVAPLGADERPPEPAPAGKFVVDRTGPLAASEGLSEITASVGEAPTLPPSNPDPSEAPKLVDAKVGDINGRAIYASRFLDAMGARLKAEADRYVAESRRRGGPNAVGLAEREWTRFARGEIMRELNTQVEDELLRAEAVSRFTPEEKQGFRAFLEKTRSELYAESGGSAARAEKRLVESEGKTLDQWYREREQTELIRYELSQTIYRRLQISWRDIENEYEKRGDVFNPPPIAHLRVIRVATAKADDVQRVNSMLNAGESFESIASSPVNDFNREQGGLQKTEIKESYEKTSFFGPEALNAAARSLTPGKWAGPVAVGNDQMWVALEKLESRSRALYDVQLIIENALRDMRAGLERARYIDRLKERASFSDLQGMTARLMTFARERFFVPAAEGRAR